MHPSPDRSLLHLGNLPSARIRDLVAQSSALRFGAAPELRVRGTVALLCGDALPYARAVVEGGAALLGLRVAVYGPAEVEALGEGGLAGARLSQVHPLVIGVGLKPGLLAEIAAGSRVPVVNGGDAEADPVGAIADLALFERRFGGLAGRRLTWVGDANGLLYDLLVGGCAVGLHVAVAHPVGFAPDVERLTWARERAAETGSSVLVTTELAEAVVDSSVVYVDVWPPDHADRFRAFAVQRHTLRDARAGVLVAHRRPELRGAELSASFAEDVGALAIEQVRARAEACAAVLSATLRPDPLCSVLG